MKGPASPQEFAKSYNVTRFRSWLIEGTTKCTEIGAAPKRSLRRCPGTAPPYWNATLTSVSCPLTPNTP